MKKFWTLPGRAFRRGQALAEYSIIVAIVAIASIAVVTVFGTQIRAVLFASGQQLSGDGSAQIEDQTQGRDGTVTRDLGNF